MKTLLLKFSGPLQSWGTSSRFENRYTDRFPSKSAVIGMISGALGYRRNEEEKIKKLNNLDFGVRIDSHGSILRDFHTVFNYAKTKTKQRTYVTNRYYLEDAVFIIGIGSDDHKVIEEIAEGMKRPYFQLSFGRRSLPVNADYYIGLTEKPVLDSLRQFPFQGNNREKHKNSSGDIFLDVIADSKICESQDVQYTRDGVKSFSQNKREHFFRPVSRTRIRLETDHDALDAIGG